MTDETDKTETEAATVARVARQHMRGEVFTLTHHGVTAPVLLVPAADGMRRVDVKPLLDPFRDRPERRTGTSRHDDVDSFIAHVNRQKDAATTLWLEGSREGIAAGEGGITAIYDYHEAAGGDARFGAHRARYPFPFSDAWQAWTGKDGEAMGQASFAEFLEDRMAVPDATKEADEALLVVARMLNGRFGGPERLMELSRGLKINVGGEVENAVTLESGEGRVTFSETHTDGKGKPLNVPTLFTIGVPVFHLDVVYRVVVRLRYRVGGGGKLVWFYQMYQVDEVLQDAIDAVAAKVKAETELPLFRGKAEGGA